MLLAGVGLAATPAMASADTSHVRPGQSIQEAIDDASPGTTINVDAGTYKENLSITKDGIRLFGHESHLVPPKSFSSNLCVDHGDMPGICVVGKIVGGNVVRTVNNVTVKGFEISKFPNEGIFAFGAKNFSATSNEFVNNGGYGVFSLRSIKVSYIGNRSLGNGDAGMYIGESPHADATVVGNTSTGNRQSGLFFRDSFGGTISDNDFRGNCAGILVLDTGAGSGAGNVVIKNNDVRANNMFCPIDGIGGIGIGLASAQDTTVRSNVVRNNLQQSGSPFGGGIVVVTAAPNPPTNNKIKNNTLSGNSPNDIFWDGSGTGNTFTGNSCSNPSNPPGLC
jgi:parallel beta-helix repeat protein